MGKRRRYRNNPGRFGRKYALKYSMPALSEPAAPLEPAVEDPPPSVTLEAPSEDAPVATLEAAEKTEAPPAPKKKRATRNKPRTTAAKATGKRANKAKTTT
jgi:capsular polysaccharide biosynthesis protein